MADNKASALKNATTPNIKLKVFYNGDTPADSGVEEWKYNLEPLDEKHIPWLFKYYASNDKNVCYQYVSSTSAYRKISRGLADILDAVIVNTKQREAIDKLVDRMLWDELCRDNTLDGDSVTF